MKNKFIYKEFDANTFFQERADHELIRFSKHRYEQNLDFKGGGSFMKSTYIEIWSNPEKVEKQYKAAIDSLMVAFDAIETMGFHIKITQFTWHNVADSCANILGNRGFFYVKFTFSKCKNK